MTTSPRFAPRYQHGQVIGGDYLVHRVLMGGMGEVYLCLNTKSIQPYALKTFQARFFDHAAMRESFKREVGNWIALEKHPNIVRCYFMETFDNQPFMVLEWVAGDETRGTDLRAWLRRGPLDLRQTLDFMIDICRGLIHAELKQPGIVHRDLKPENILIAENRTAKITDFGLAKIAREANQSGADLANGPSGSGIAGTPPYMAPEQWREGPVDSRTDVYALGCMLFEMLTGQRPFEANTFAEYRHQHLNGTIPNPPTAITVPELSQLITRCLAKDRQERPSVNNLMTALEHIYQKQFGTHPKPLVVAQAFTALDYVNRAGTLGSLGRYKEALADCERALEISPNLGTAYASRGNVYYHLKQFDQAVADYDRALKLDDDLVRLYSNRSALYLELDRYVDAVADCTRAIQIDPQYAKAYANRASALDEMQKYDQALADCNRALELQPNYARAFITRGSVYSGLQQFDQALADYTHAIELDPFEAGAYYNRGLLYGKLKHYVESVQDCTRAIENDPTLWRAYYNRGVSYGWLKRYDRALEDFARTEQMEPTYAQLYLTKGGLLIDLGRRDEARTCFERAAALGDSHGAALVAQLNGTRVMLVPPDKTPLRAFMLGKSQGGVGWAKEDGTFTKGLSPSEEVVAFRSAESAIDWAEASPRKWSVINKFMFVNKVRLPETIRVLVESAEYTPAHAYHKTTQTRVEAGERVTELTVKFNPPPELSMLAGLKVVLDAKAISMLGAKNLRKPDDMEGHTLTLTPIDPDDVFCPLTVVRID